MHVEMRPIGSIKPYEQNPRVNDAGVDAVAASLREFGWQQPLVVDERDVIIVGHTRYKAALKLGMTEVPVHVAVGLTPEQARAYRIADNQTATLSQWDDGKLVEELMALQTAGFDLDLTGFSADELTRLMGSGGIEPQADPDNVPEPPADPETKPGDLWLLGNHRLLCGDATKPADVARLMAGTTADLLLTDPPYGVAYVGKTKAELTIANDDLADDDQYRAFLAQAFQAALVHVRPGGGFYVWHADVRGLPVRLACADAGLQVRQVLVWAKQTMVLGRQDYQWRHEPCLYGWRDGAAHTWLGDRTQTTILEFDRPARNADHPTGKPVDLFRYLVGNSCPPRGRVLDPFGGGGSTLIAAELEGRTAYLMELDPAYCDVVVRRFEAVTGKTAEREPAGNGVPHGSPTLATFATGR
jgi:site-specific DNA-methyltransferase (adenine-specific)